MRYLLYSFYGDIFFAKEYKTDPNHFCDIWTTGTIDSLDPGHEVHSTPEENDFGFMLWFDSPQSVEETQQQYPELFI